MLYRGLRRHTPAVIAVAVLGALGAPALARADATYCVPSAAIAGCPAGGVAEPSIGSAFAVVDGDPTGAHDVIRIGPGTYDEANLGADGSHSVAVIGAGEGTTTIAPSGGNGSPDEQTLAIGAGSTVSGLTIQAVPGPANTGLSLGGAAFGVAVEATSSTTAAVGVRAYGSAVLSHVAISVPGDGTGVLAGGLDDDPLVADTTITAGTGLSGSAHVERSTITAGVGLSMAGDVSSAPLVLDSSVVMTQSGPAGNIAVTAPAGQSATPGVERFRVLLRHDTLVGAAGSTGVNCSSQWESVPGSTASGSCIVDADADILVGFLHPFLQTAAAGPGAGQNAYAEIDTWSSDFDPSGDISEDFPGGGTAQGAITSGYGDLTANPDFASTNPASPNAWELAPGSPLIDQGGGVSEPFPGQWPAESPTDLYGRPRAVSVRTPSPGASDIGATEYQPPLLTLSARSTRSRAPAGVSEPFLAQAAIGDPADTVTVRWSFDDGASATGASVSHAFRTPGRHTASATATALDGQSLTRTVSITVTPVPPRLWGLRLATPARQLHRGLITLALQVSRPSSIEIAIVPLGPVAARCRTKRAAHSAVCWMVRVTFAESVHAGRGRVLVPTEFRGHRLPAGRYRLRVSAADPSGPSRPQLTRAFTIQGP